MEATPMVSAYTGDQSLGEKSLSRLLGSGGRSPLGAPLHLLWSLGTLDNNWQSPELGGASALGPPEGLRACLWPRRPDAQFLKRASFQAACSSSGLWQLPFVAPTGPSLGRGSLWQFSAQW